MGEKEIIPSEVSTSCMSLLMRSEQARELEWENKTTPIGPFLIAEGVVTGQGKKESCLK